MRTRHHFQVIPNAKARPVRASDLPARLTPDVLDDTHTSGNQESRDLEQLRQSLATISANDRHILLRYFDQLARYVATVKFSSAESDPTHS